MTTPTPPEDPDLKAAQIDKLRAETDKLRAERAKLEREADAVPRQASGSYWSEVLKIVGAVVLGVGGVVTAGGSYFTARNQVELAELKAAQANEKLKTAEAAASAASTAAAEAVRIRDTARKEREDAEKSVKELRDTLSDLTAKVQVAKPELITQRLVYLQFRGELSRDLINALRKSLGEAGFNAPGAERIAGDYQSLIKYFRLEDQPAAEALRKQTEEFFAAQGCPIQLRAVQAQTTAKTPPLEAWLSHVCKR